MRVPVTGSWDFGMDGWMDWVGYYSSHLILSYLVGWMDVGLLVSGFWFLVSHGDVFMECKISA